MDQAGKSQDRRALRAENDLAGGLEVPADMNPNASGTAVVFARSTLAAAPTGVRQLPVASPQLTPRC